MEYRINRKTGDKISVIGLGTSYISEAPEKDAVEALGSVRKEMYYQVHFGANATGE